MVGLAEDDAVRLRRGGAAAVGLDIGQGGVAVNMGLALTRQVPPHLCDQELVSWHVTDEGTFVNGARASSVTLDQLQLNDHHAIRLRIGIDEDAEHPGGLNIFGRGFGNHDQDIVMRLHLRA